MTIHEIIETYLNGNKKSAVQAIKEFGTEDFIFDFPIEESKETMLMILKTYIIFTDEEL